MDRRATYGANQNVVAFGRFVLCTAGKYPPVPTRYSTPLRGLIESMLKQNPKVSGFAGCAARPEAAAGGGTKPCMSASDDQRQSYACLTAGVLLPSCSHAC